MSMVKLRQILFGGGLRNTSEIKFAFLFCFHFEILLTYDIHKFKMYIVIIRYMHILQNDYHNKVG